MFRALAACAKAYVAASSTARRRTFIALWAIKLVSHASSSASWKVVNSSIGDMVGRGLTRLGHCCEDTPTLNQEGRKVLGSIKGVCIMIFIVFRFFFRK